MAEGTLSAGSVSLAVKPDTANFAGELKSKILGGVSGIGEGMGGMILGGLKSMAGPIAAVAAGFGIKHIIDDSVQSFENLAGSVKGMQRVLGGTTEEVSGLRGAMQLSGVQVDNIGTTLTRFSKNVAAAGDSSSTAGKMFKAMGIDTKDAHGALLPMSTLLPQIADQFKDMPNGPEKTAAAIALFGRQGTQMLPFLSKGSEGIAELTQKAKDMGLVLDDSAMDKFAKSKAATREFNAQMEGLKVTLGEAFLPVLEAVQESIRGFFIPLIERATKFVKEHQKQFDALAETIKSVLQPVVEGLLSTVKNLVTWIVQNKDMVMALAVAIGAGVLAFEAYKLVTEGITLAQKGWLALQAIFKVVTGEATLAQMGFNAALIANPIGLVIAAIAALIAGLVWFFTQTDVGKKIWADFTKFLGDAWSGFTKWITDVWNGASKWLTDAFNAIGKFFSDTWSNIGKAFKVAIDFIANLILNWSLPGIVAKVVGWVIGHWDDVVKFFKDSGTKIIGFFSDAWNWLVEAGANIIRGLIRGATSMGDAVANWVSNLGNSIISGFKRMFGIKSPSTVFHGFGVNIGEGLVNGLGSMNDAVKDSITTLGDVAIDGMTKVNGKIGDLVAARNDSLKSQLKAGLSRSEADNIVNAQFGGSLQAQIDTAMGSYTFTNASTGMSTTIGAGLDPSVLVRMAQSLRSQGYKQTSGATINYFAAPNDSISAEQKLVDAVQRAKVLGAV